MKQILKPISLDLLVIRFDRLTIIIGICLNEIKKKKFVPNKSEKRKKIENKRKKIGFFDLIPFLRSIAFFS